MPIFKKKDAQKFQLSGGGVRWTILDYQKGSESLWVGDLSLPPGGSVETHIHKTEEAMVVIEGELDAILGDEVIKVSEGETVLAPKGIRHALINNSNNNARVIAIFPTSKMEKTSVD